MVDLEQPWLISWTQGWGGGVGSGRKDTSSKTRRSLPDLNTICRLGSEWTLPPAALGRVMGRLGTTANRYGFQQIRFPTSEPPWSMTIVFFLSTGSQISSRGLGIRSSPSSH